MRLTSFETQGRQSYGVVTDGGVVDVGAALGGRAPTLRALLALDGGLSEARALAERGPLLPFDAIHFRPVITDPEKILCVGVNYHAHREETGRAESAYPTLFTRFANTQVGHGEALVRPRASNDLDYEGELAVIIGKRGRHIPEARAFEHVAGYACYQDASVRDWQRHTSQFTPGKNFVATGGLGPWMVTADALPDPTKLTLRTRVNGTTLQETTTDLLIFSIPKLLAYISTFTELVPGDVIATGTPGGVGWKRTPPVWLQPGDVVEVDIDGVGVLRNPVVQEAG